MGRRYGDFNRLHKALRTELPGKVLPPLPKKNKQSSTASNLIKGAMGRDDDDDDKSSLSSVSTMGVGAAIEPMKNLTVRDQRRTGSGVSLNRMSPRSSIDKRSMDGRPPVSALNGGETIILWRENQRISLRAFLRSLLANPQVANTKTMKDFLTLDPMTPKDEDVEDIMRRKAMDEKRVEEQKQFYEIARKRAADLDVYMER